MAEFKFEYAKGKEPKVKSIKAEMLVTSIGVFLFLNGKEIFGIYNNGASYIYDPSGNSRIVDHAINLDDL